MTNADVLALLTALGGTRAKVALTLRTGGYRGFPGKSSHCPIAKYLQDKGVENPNVNGDAVIWGPPGHRLVTMNPEPVSAFIARFDDEKYPDMIPGGAK